MPSAAKRTSASAKLREALRRAVTRADGLLPGPRVVLTRELSRRLDAACVQEFGIPSILLMEHASLGIAAVAREVCRRTQAGVLVLAGTGNNGGDGLASARHIWNAGGITISVVLAGSRERLTGDARANLLMAESCGVRVVDASASPGSSIARAIARVRGPVLLIDALLGTGLASPAAGPALEAIRQCNRLREARDDLAVLAVDVPSGLDADTGAPPAGGEAVRTDATITMAALKPGLVGVRAREWSGKVGVVSIGAPAKLLMRLGNADRQIGRGGQGDVGSGRRG